MAGAAMGFATGFLNQVSSGIENKRKYEMETQRDLDKIAMNNIFETARDFQKNYSKSVADIRKKNERFATAMQLTGNNQAAAEAIAADPDIKLHDFDKISEIATTMKGPEGYTSSIPKDTQAQLDALNARVNQTFTQAQKYMDKSRAFKKSGMTSPFEQPTLETSIGVEAGTRPTMTIPPKNRMAAHIQYVMNNSDKITSPEAGIQVLNILLEADGAPPVPLSQASRFFPGVPFGGAKDYKNDSKYKMLRDHISETNPGLSPEEVDRRTRAAATKNDRSSLQISNEPGAYLKYLGAISSHVASMGKADIVRDPVTGYPSFKFSAQMSNEFNARLDAAMSMAQKSLQMDILEERPIKTPAEYALEAAKYYGIYSHPKDYDEPNFGAGKTPTEIKNQRAGVGAAPQTQHPAPQGVPPAAPAAPKRMLYNPNDDSITPKGP